MIPRRMAVLDIQMNKYDIFLCEQPYIMQQHDFDNAILFLKHLSVRR